MKDVFKLSEMIELEMFKEEDFFQVEPGFEGLQFIPMIKLVDRRIRMFEITLRKNRHNKDAIKFKFKIEGDTSGKIYFTTTAAKMIVAVIKKLNEHILQNGITLATISEDKPIECTIRKGRAFLFME